MHTDGYTQSVNGHELTVDTSNVTNMLQPRVPMQGTTLYDAPVYSHESVFRSQYLKVSIRCPDAWVYEEEEDGNGAQDIPVFGSNDLVGGSVALSPELSGRGKLNISIEGSFVYISPTLPKPKDTNLPQPLVHEHIFFSGSMAIATYPPEVAQPPPSTVGRAKSRRPPQRARTRGLSLKDTFGFSFGANIKKRFFNRGSKSPEEILPAELRGPATPNELRDVGARKSTSNIPDNLMPFPFSPVSTHPVSSASSYTDWKSHTFSFPLPSLEGLEMPPSFSCSHIIDIAGIRGRAYAENAEVSYRLFVTWESLDNDKRASIAAPFLYCPVQDDLPPASQSVNGHNTETETEQSTSEWADFAFDPEPTTRPPFGCMLTLPYPCSYPRTKSLPYYIFFATNSLYEFLSNDIRKESTIFINLVRVVTMDGSAGAIEAVSPIPDTTPTSAPIVAFMEVDPPKKQITGGLNGKRQRANSLSGVLQRVTTPIFARRKQPLSAQFPPIPAPIPPVPGTPEKPKYLPPEKKLPVLPPSEESLIVDSRIVARDVIVGFRKHPEVERAEKEARKARRESSSSEKHQKRSHSKSRKRPQSDSMKSTTTSYIPNDAVDKSGVTVSTTPKVGGPHGMVHGRLPLDRDMIISMAWLGLSVEYFLEVEVKYGSDVLKCRAGVTINSDLT